MPCARPSLLAAVAVAAALAFPGAAGAMPALDATPVARAAAPADAAKTVAQASAAPRRGPSATPLLIREAGRAHVPEPVLSGTVPGARAPLVGIPALVGAIVDAVTGTLTPAATATPSPQPAATPAPTPTPTPTVPAVGVYLKDTPSYSATLTRATVTAGPVRVQLQNQGEDPHDLKVERIDDGSSPGSFASTDPGQTRTKTLTLAAGSYRFYCSFQVPVVHATAGMRATLTVVPG